MKKSFHVFFLFVLFAFFAVNAAWAYNVTIDNKTGGTVTSNKETAEQYDDYVELTITPASHYALTGIKVVKTENAETIYDNIFFGGTTCTFQMLAFDVSVIPSWVKTYDVEVANVSGGTVIKEFDSDYAEGIEVKLTITPDANNDYLFKGIKVVKKGTTEEVTVNTANVTETAGGTAKFTMPASDVTVTATFEKPHSVTVTNGVGGEVQTDKATATLGDKVTLTILPDLINDYELTNLEVTYGENGTVVVTRTGNTATFTMPASDVTVTPTWEKQYSVSITDVDGGDIQTNKLKATQGTTVTLTITPDANNDYLFKGVKVVKKGTTEEVTVNTTNVTETAGGTASFTMPASDVTVTAAFEKQPRKVEISTITGGTVETENATTTYGSTVELTITPDASNDYLFKGVKVVKKGTTEEVTVNTTNVAETTGGTASFTMPASDVTVTPSFAKVEHSVTIVSVDGGTVETDMTTATQMTDVTLTIKPDVANDYVLKILEVKDAAGNTVNDVREYSSTEWRFGMPASDVTVTPSFAKVERSVIITNVTGGTVTTDNATTSYDATVTLTIAPTSGYHLNSLAVKDAAENDVNVTLSNDKTKATFKMPKSNVTVNPFWNAELIKDGEGYYVNMPVVGTNTLDLAEYIANGITSFKVYDDGGKDGNYNTLNATGILALNAPEGFIIQIKGTSTLNSGHMTIDDENGSKYDFGSSNGTENTREVSYLSTDNTVNIVFSTDKKYTTSGLDFAVNVVPVQGVVVKNVAGGEVSTDKSTADAGATVTLTVTPNEGYMLNSISVVDLHGNSVAVNGGTWYIGAKTMTFTMPEEAVFVTPLFVPVSGIFVNVPKKGKNEVVVLEGVESFNVYDYGGKDGNYSEASDGILQLTAPENYVFQISGSAETEVARDFLRIYDGNVVAEGLLLSNVTSGSIDLNGANILTSTNNVITVNFYSTGHTNGRGFDLKVTLVKPSYGAVSIAKADDGKIHATINGDYEGTEKLSIPEAIEVDAVDYERDVEAGVPVTAMLPVTLPVGTTVNAKFYTLKEVVQDGNKWHATMKYIGDEILPQPNTPYAVILNEGESELKFNLNGKKATVQTGDIQKTCGFEKECNLDENDQITDDWYFTGTYAYKQWIAGDEEIGLAYAFSAVDNPGGAAKGKFGKIVAGASGSPMRCYLRKRDANVKLKQQNQTQMVAAAPYVVRYGINNMPETIDVDFVTDDEKGGRTVLHGRMNTVTGEFKMLRDYDLKGRKVNSTNRARGAYYGKKVLKK